MSAARRAWIVAASIGAVEALKDQGFCRWNYPIRSLQQQAKTNLMRSYRQVQRLSGGSSSSSAAIASKMREERAKRTEEKLKKVMELNCWGPNTIRF